MLAQALVEYGMLSSLVTTIERTAMIVEDFARGVDGRIAIGVLIIVMFAVFKRR